MGISHRLPIAIFREKIHRVGQEFWLDLEPPGAEPPRSSLARRGPSGSGTTPPALTFPETEPASAERSAP